MNREMISTHYYDENGEWRNNKTDPLFLEFVNLEIEGDKAYAELGCMGYGTPLQASEWGGCEFWLTKTGDTWVVTSTHIRGI